MSRFSSIIKNVGLALGLAAGEEQIAAQKVQHTASQSSAPEKDPAFIDIFPDNATAHEKSIIVQAFVRGISTAMGVDREKHDILAEYDGDNLEFRARNRTGKLPDGTIVSDITITAGMAKKLSPDEMFFVIAHEVAHGEQRHKGVVLDGQAAEADADVQAGALTGAQTGINALEKLGTNRPQNHIAGGNHPTIRERQANLINAFPEQSPEIIRPEKSKIPDTLEAVPPRASIDSKKNDCA